VHSEFNTPSAVAASAAGNTLAASNTTFRSDVVRLTTACLKGTTAPITAAKNANTAAVESQKDVRAASPSPRPRWNPTRTAMTMLNMAFTAPAQITVAVLTAVVAATASTPSRDTRSVVLCPTIAENTSVPTSGTA
jgi:hypothetical protein